MHVMNLLTALYQILVGFVLGPIVLELQFVDNEAASSADTDALTLIQQKQMAHAASVAGAAVTAGTIAAASIMAALSQQQSQQRLPATTPGLSLDKYDSVIDLDKLRLNAGLSSTGVMMSSPTPAVLQSGSTASAGVSPASSTAAAAGHAVASPTVPVPNSNPASFVPVPAAPAPPGQHTQPIVPRIPGSNPSAGPAPNPSVRDSTPPLMMGTDSVSRNMLVNFNRGIRCLLGQNTEFQDVCEVTKSDLSDHLDRVCVSVSL